MTAVYVSEAAKTIAGVAVRDASNVLCTANLGRVRDAASALRAFFGSNSVALSRDFVSGAVNSSQPASMPTQGVEALPSGGAPPYSYAWAMTGSSGGTWTISSPAQAWTSFTGGPCEPGESFEATFTCAVTDAIGMVTTSGEVAAFVENIGYNATGGGGPLP